MAKHQDHPKTIRNRLNLAGFCIALLAGAGIASVLWYYHTQKTIQAIASQIKPLRQQNSSYKFISPLLGYEVPDNIKEFNEYLPLKNKIDQAVTTAKEPSLSSFAVYFRDLSMGRWTGINESSGYAPASMMKAAIMIAYYKQAEANPQLLDKTFVYTDSVDGQIGEVPFETPSNLQVGKTYTIDELINAMIINSDNGAKNILLDNINQPDLDDIYTDLGLPNPDNNNNYTITPKQYALLLRVLYNATYLSRTYSEKALQTLSQAKYSKGLVAGVPQNTTVAQKFGENVDTSAGTQTISLSNCGVIYHPTHPYILCVMTKGSNVDALAKTIALISSTTWNEVNSYTVSNN